MALLGNPQDVLTTPYGYSGQMSPETAVQEQALNRKRLIANMLMQQGIQPQKGQMAGRFYVAPSPVQGLAGLAQAGMGAFLGNQIDKKQGDLAKGDREAYQAAIKDYLAKISPQEQAGQPDQAAPPMHASPQGQFNGEVGATPMPEPAVQSAQPPIPREMLDIPPPIDRTGTTPNEVIARDNIGLDMANVQPADMSQAAGQAPPPGLEPPPPLMPQGAPPAMPQAPPVDKRKALIELMMNQHPMAQRFAAMEMQRLQQEQEHQRDQGNKDRGFGLDERGLQLKADETRAVRESADAYRQASLGTQLTGMGINAEHNRALEGIQKQNADTTASHNKAMEQIQKQQADTQRMQALQGKVPPGYRATKDGALEAIPGGPADQKKQGAYNQDIGMLNSSTANMDRLASSANQILNHPGLKGITGLRGALPDVPGTDAANARALLQTMKSQIAFDVLQEMRNNSKTGGALGNVSDAEGKRLEANLAALDSAQSPEQFKAQLKQVLSYVEGAKGRLREAFNLKHGESAGKAQGETPKAERSLDDLLKKYGN